MPDISPAHIAQNNHTATVRRLKRSAQTAPGVFSEKEQAFIAEVLKGRAPSAVGRELHLDHRKMLERPDVRHAIRQAQQRVEMATHMTRKRVMDGILEAVEMAKLQADPSQMINGWDKIARMCGYYATETKKVEISVNGEVQIKRLQTLSDEDLLKLAQGEALEGEFTQVLGEGAGGVLDEPDPSEQ